MTNEATTALLCVGVPCAWWGSLVAISFLETPLKFRAPGITVPLALGIGRLVFRALNYLESGFALVVLVGLLRSATALRASSWVLFAAICLVLMVQGGLLRPALDRRATAAPPALRRRRSREGPGAARSCHRCCDGPAVTTTHLRARASLVEQEPNDWPPSTPSDLHTF